MNYTILPILGFYQFGWTGSVLPDWYTNYYSQEDRLKAIAKQMQRLVKWDELALEKINELVKNVNDLGAADLQELLNNINEVKTTVSDLNEDVSDINSSIVSINSAVSENTEDIIANNVDIDNLTTKVNTLETKVNNITTQVSTINSHLSTLDSSVSSINEDLVSLSEDLNSFTEELNNINENVSENTAEIDSVKATTVSLTEDLNETNVLLTTTKNNVSTLSSTVDSQGNRITALEENSSGGGTDPALESRVSTLETGAEETNAEISTIKTDVSSQGTRITALEENSSGGGTDNELAVKVEILETRMDNQEENINIQLNDMIQQNITDISSQGERITVLEENSGGGSSSGYSLAEEISAKYKRTIKKFPNSEAFTTATIGLYQEKFIYVDESTGNLYIPFEEGSFQSVPTEDLGYSEPLSTTQRFFRVSTFEQAIHDDIVGYWSDGTFKRLISLDMGAKSHFTEMFQLVNGKGEFYSSYGSGPTDDISGYNQASVKNIYLNQPRILVENNSVNFPPSCFNIALWINGEEDEEGEEGLVKFLVDFKDPFFDTSSGTVNFSYNASDNTRVVVELLPVYTYF